MNWAAKLRRIRAVVLDVDGVLTDGRVGYGGDGEEIKFFHVHDGLGVKQLQRAGIRVGILSGRCSAANTRRAQELGLDFVMQGEPSKPDAFKRLLAEQELLAEQCLYVGDDVPDIEVLRLAGVGVAVADAVPEVAAVADRQTRAGGGAGAVREVARWVLEAQRRQPEATGKGGAET